MNVSTALRRAVALFACVVTLPAISVAQSYEEQAKAILQLFESGQKDSAYVLIEPLKRSARFVPAVIFTRAQMTPDDRALSLYKEIIALEPGGAWADEAAYQLVRRYVDKRDSLAASTWMTALRVNYPRSPFIPAGEDLLRNTTSWAAASEIDAPERPTEGGAVASTPRRDTPPKSPTPTTPEPKRGPAAPSDTYRSSGMRGFALQVGLFPTRQAAETKAGALKKKNVKAVPLPKTVDGRKQYALVVGPYPTIEEANRKKGTISTACDCPAFVVRVE